MKNLNVWLLAIALSLVGIAVAWYKIGVLGLPLSPEAQQTVWTVEARASMRASGGPVKADLVIPTQPPGFEVLDEDFISANFGVTQAENDLNREAQWSVRRAQGTQVVYYRVTVFQDDSPMEHSDPFPGFPRVPNWDETTQSAINALLQSVRAESADIATFARQLIRRMNTRNGSDEIVAMLQERAAPGPGAAAQQIVELLAGARIPARVIWGVQLVDGARDAPLVPWIEVHNEDRWIPISPSTGEQGYPRDFIAWRIGDATLLSLTGATRGEVTFSVSKGLRDVVALAHKRADQKRSRMMDFSLLNLPVQTQNVYKVLLTVPLGAFLVVLLRNIVGVKTFGTFMPILIALAFRETQLIWGMVLFTMLVALGLAVRFMLERLKLLLVPRLAAVLIIVIFLMLGVSMISLQLGLDRGLSIALFPMVILAMTIERMSLVWEEHGPQEAIMQGLGSLLVAALGYLVMSNELMAHVVFVFPELLLVLLGVTLVLGRYTGYRLSEFWRFRSVIIGVSGHNKPAGGK
ncbi:inactive transglutaminase family protein [bacterium]|nr:inactive transglutaminase family protein [bacterium]